MCSNWLRVWAVAARQHDSPSYVHNRALPSMRTLQHDGARRLWVPPHPTLGTHAAPAAQSRRTSQRNRTAATWAMMRGAGRDVRAQEEALEVERCLRDHALAQGAADAFERFPVVGQRAGDGSKVSHHIASARKQVCSLTCTVRRCPQSIGSIQWPRAATPRRCRHDSLPEE